MLYKETKHLKTIFLKKIFSAQFIKRVFNLTLHNIKQLLCSVKFA